MTDPIKLLEDHCPEVPGAGAAERTTARAVLEASIQAETATRGDFQPHRGWRRVRGRVAAAAAVTVAAVAGGALGWPSSTPTALAGWDATPSRPSAEETAEIERLCREELEQLDLPGFVPRPPVPELALVDQRGALAQATFVGYHDGYRMNWGCTLRSEDDKWVTHRPGGSVSVTPLGGDLVPGAERLVDLDASITLTVDHVGNPESEEFQTARVIFAEIFGQVDDGISRVEVEADGETYETLLVDGFFSVFWPNPEVPPASAEIRMYGADGELAETHRTDVPRTDMP